MTASINSAMTAKSDERRAAGVAFGAHALHDGYTDLVYVLLPIWQSEFGLGFAALGLMKTVFSGTLAGFQIPAGFLAERFGAPGHGQQVVVRRALLGFGEDAEVGQLHAEQPRRNAGSIRRARTPNRLPASAPAAIDEATGPLAHWAVPGWV